MSELYNMCFVLCILGLRGFYVAMIGVHAWQTSTYITFCIYTVFQKNVTTFSMIS